eukprot:5963203-Heterocapsa_arctica.AAC.1
MKAGQEQSECGKRRAGQEDDTSLPHDATEPRQAGLQDVLRGHGLQAVLGTLSNCLCEPAVPCNVGQQHRYGVDAAS